MFVRWQSPWARTAHALHKRGLVKMGYAGGGFNAYEVTLTDAGKALVERGVVTAPRSSQPVSESVVALRVEDTKSAVNEDGA